MTGEMSMPVHTAIKKSRALLSVSCQCLIIAASGETQLNEGMRLLEFVLVAESKVH